MLEVRYRGQCLNIDSFKEVWARQWVPSTLRVVGGDGFSICNTAEPLGFTASGC